MILERQDAGVGYIGSSHSKVAVIVVLKPPKRESKQAVHSLSWFSRPVVTGKLFWCGPKVFRKGARRWDICVGVIQQPAQRHTIRFQIYVCILGYRPVLGDGKYGKVCSRSNDG